MTESLTELIAAVPDAAVVTDRQILETYRRDRAHAPKAGWPIGVVRATSTADVQATLQWASEYAIPVVPRGAGSGLSGGATAVDGGLVLSTERMRDVVVDPGTRTVTAQAGALNSDIKDAAAQHGLWYPPDPSSYEMCSIGGNVATNAGGLCCVKYGVTSDYVLGLEVVLADGQVMRLGGPLRKDVAGLSLVPLFIGSEGLLGVITEVTLRLLPSQNTCSTVVGIFASLSDAADAVLRVTSQLRPSMLELMDRASINAVEDLTHMGLDRSAAAILIGRTDAIGTARADEAAAIADSYRYAGAVEVFRTDDPAEGEALAAARRAVLPAVERLGTLLLEDVGVPLPKLPRLLTGIEAIADQYAITIAVVAHAGDGNAHPLIVFDPTNDVAELAAREAFHAVMALALSLGGTITGEHGVGRLKRQWLPEYLGADVMQLQGRIKKALDPAGILNPGAVL